MFFFFSSRVKTNKVIFKWSATPLNGDDICKKFGKFYGMCLCSFYSTHWIFRVKLFHMFRLWTLKTYLPCFFLLVTQTTRNFCYHLDCSKAYFSNKYSTTFHSLTINNLSRKSPRGPMLPVGHTPLTHNHKCVSNYNLLLYTENKNTSQCNVGVVQHSR